MATYREEYQAFIENELLTGGKPGYMEVCVREFNAVGQPTYEPTDAYKTWAHQTEHTCTTCQHKYRWETKNDFPHPDDETICRNCR